ncbi:murein biosynthesis integral membrane protein MurJ [Lentibacter algarum]|uniref:murein biosynthesis integral membrane protein MurJ n=1 Tax=Lentibacter algarum TaxID=576131 RepID=UPI001C089A1F|nr:murein biosynthesis integral membrane protein MurJ [Lentibacter algarum]MBU2983504.1 murein biosynthesis integral membrane protein MurJ [Lentibacter algarum]
MKPIRLIASIFTVGFWTLMSRILGFARDILISAYIGPGPLMDAYVVAFRLPNLFRRFFAEGAFNAAFVPMFSKRLEADEAPEAFASNALSWLSFAVLTLTGLALVFMPALVWLTAEGFSNDARFDLATGFGRIVFPYIFFISLAALFSGVLNATGRFAAAAAAPVLLNIMLVAAMLFAAYSGGEVVKALIYTIPFAGLAQLALVWLAAERAGMRIRPHIPRPSAEMAHLLRVALPAALAMGVVQINLVVGQLVASDFEKAVSWLYAADRLYQLPLGVVGIAVGIVLLPDLSRRLKAGDDTGARAAYSRASEVSLALTIPAAIALIVIPLPLISVLFERGNFTADDAASTALAVAVYGLGLPAFVLQKTLQPLFFAREDTKSPFRYALVAMVVNLVLAFGLKPYIGWLAPAVAASAAAWLMVAQLGFGARKFGTVTKFDARFKSRIWRIILAAALMGALLFWLNLALSPMFDAGALRYLALVILILAGIIGYFGLGQLLGAFRLAEFKAAARRG